MELGKSREEIISKLKIDIPKLIKDKESLESVLDFLHNEYNIPKSYTLDLFNEPNKVDTLNTTELGLIAEQVNFHVNGNKEWINEYFTDTEIKVMRVYKKPKRDKKIKRTFSPAIKLDENVYVIGVTRKDIALWYDNGVFLWDENIQREGVEQFYGDEVIIVPTINHSNVEEIKEQTLKGTLMANELAYNVVLGSSDSGQELYYNPETSELSIAEDALGQIIDGAHRSLGIHSAWMENNNINGMMPVRLSNYSTEEAARYQVELSKAVPLDKSRIRALDRSVITNKIVNELKIDGELMGKISDKSTPNKELGQLVSFLILSKAFEDFFKVETTLQVRNIANSFKEYLVYLFGDFNDYKDNKNYFLFNNKIFYLHVYIFKRMMDENIPFSDLTNVIDIELFKKGNENLEKYKLRIDSNESIKSKNAGLKYVEDLMIGKYSG